jgi:integrase
VTSIVGLLHKAFADALEENIIDANPVLRITSRRQMWLHQRRSTSDRLIPAEVTNFPAAVPELHRRIWMPTLKRAGLRLRGQYNIRDTFITIALSAGEDPGWVARICGTSEQMIFQHYRRWIPGLQTDAGQKVGRVFGEAGGIELSPQGIDYRTVELTRFSMLPPMLPPRPPC